MINWCIYFLLEMKASCVISTQRSISKYMKAMGIKRISKKQKHQITNQGKKNQGKNKLGEKKMQQIYLTSTMFSLNEDQNQETFNDREK